MKRLFVLSILISFIAGCGTQLHAIKSCEDSSCSGQNPLDSLSGASPTWDDVLLEAKVVGGVHDKQQTLTFNRETKIIRMRVPVSGGAFLGQANNLGAIPGVANSEIGIDVEPDGSTVIIIQMPLASLIAGMTSSNQSSTLPNGSALPHFPSDSLSYNDVEMNASAAVTARIYMSSGTFGIFVETPFNPFIQISFPHKNENGEVLGYLTQIPAQGSFAGGFFMSTVLPDELKLIVQSLL